MKLPNGYGGIRHLKGKRRKPYEAVITTGFTDSGKQIQRALGYYRTRAEALNALAEYNQSPIDLTFVTFGEVYQRFYPTLERFSHSKQRAVSLAYSRCGSITDKKISAVTIDDLQTILSGLTGYSQSTQSQQLTFFRDIYAYAVSRGIVRADITPGLYITAKTPLPKVNVLSQDEIEKLPPRFTVLLYTGLRVGEFLAVEPTDISDGLIRVHGTKTASAERIVPVHKNIEETITTIRWGGNYHELLADFHSVLPDHKPHDLRKTFATALNRSGVPERVIKRLLGHTIGDVTDSTYIETTVEELRKAVEALDFSVL